MSIWEMEENFIKELPDGENAAIDESLLWVQVRIRRDTEWETELRKWLAEMLEAE